MSNRQYCYLNTMIIFGNFIIFFSVLPVTNVPFNVVYDFIDDRFNAIRQDATIQELSKQDWIDILAPIVRFHAYAAYK